MPDTALQGEAGLLRLGPLLAETPGRPEVVVAVVDGPVDGAHPDLAGARLTAVPGAAAEQAACRVADSVACGHGTFVAGMLAAARDAPLPGICPGCTILVRPVLCEAAPGSACPAATPADLAAAIVDAVAAGARIVNLSLGADAAGLGRDPRLDEALDYALRRGVLVVAAAGNHGHIGPTPLVRHPWLVPVAACDGRGRPLRMSNLGVAIGRSGLLAPGADLAGLAPGGGYQRMSGTSVAVPFVTGAAALLWSLFPAATGPRLRAALLGPGTARRSVVPPLLDAAASLAALSRPPG